MMASALVSTSASKYKFEIYRPVTVGITQHALKGQKLLAQGNALGIKAASKAPCKGKSFKTQAFF